MMAIKVFSWVLIVALLLGFLHVSATSANAVKNDVKSLMAFKNSIAHDPYSVLQDWQPHHSVNACNWTGIHCSRRHPGRVVSVDLVNCALQGSLSAHVANLSMLKALDLFNNSFFGTIPPNLGSLSKLQMLSLSNNNLEGPIPPTLGNLSFLQDLILSTNHLNGSIPASFENLTRLSILYLYRNSLTGAIPEFLGGLGMLTDLELSHNHLSGTLPVSLGQLTHLEFLYLENNDLHGQIPSQFGNLSSLQYIELGSNSFEGTLPPSIGRLKNLQQLRLYNNSFWGNIPQSMANLTSLIEWNLNFNKMQGTLPAWISTLPKLQYLTLSRNYFTGVLPDSWRNKTSFIQLTVDLNNLQGTLPTWLGEFTHLEWLNLASNRFTSSGSNSNQAIPILKALLNCTRLIFLNMEINYLRGVLPSNMGYQWPRLQKLYLSYNIIYGRVPTSIGNLSSIFKLVLSDNFLDGSIPAEVGNMSSIQYIDFSNNQLQGSIPSQLAGATSTLSYLFLDENRLSGVSSSLGELQNLRKLRMKMNLLSGQIPPELGQCFLLEDLDLSGNNLSGEIPPQVAGLKGIQFSFNLSRNALTGRVPEKIAGMQMAQFIDLSSNHLSGNIGIHIVEWLNAVQINLSFNSFRGNLSEKIGDELTQLQSLDLSHNFFTGSVPKSLSKLSYLDFLNLSYNNFEGQINCTQGTFRNLSRWSFIVNPLLCGGCFGLIECKNSEHHTPHSSTILKILLITIGSLFAVLLTGIVMWLFWRKLKSSKSSFIFSSTVKERYMKLSMEELHGATQNFSEVNLIGQGTYGKVYYGELSQGHRVAVKLFLPFSESKSEKSFKRECQILGQLRHRNIIKILTVVVSDEFRAIVMPYMSNGSLDSLLHVEHGGQRSSLCLDRRLCMLKELASAVSYLHHDCSPPIIHCDIKPQNVLLNEDMTVKLSDFGIAQLIATKTQATSSSSLAIQGTVGYVAPEYGMGGEVSRKGDVYSFGVVIMVMMTGTEPTSEMFGPHLTLRDWVSTIFQADREEIKIERLTEILRSGDNRGGGIEIQNEKELEAVQGILKVGLLCTSRDAASRPSMKEVESILSMILHSLSSSSSSTSNIQHQMRLPHNNLDEVIMMMQTQAPLNVYGKAQIRRVSTSTS